jgi:hypothetical protein
MAGLWRNDPATPEGKYPIALRRDGSAMDSRFIVLALKDPCVPAALYAYAGEAERLGMDPQYVRDFRHLAAEAQRERAKDPKPSDPDAPKHRIDDPVVLAWARSIGCPGQ